MLYYPLITIFRKGKIMTEECKFCKYFMPHADGIGAGHCYYGIGHPALPSEYCSKFEYKAQYISVDISRVEDNLHFKSTYSATTSSDVIVSISADGAAAVLGVDIQQSYQERMLDELEKIKKGKVKKGLEIMGQLNLGVIKVRIKKSWEY